MLTDLLAKIQEHIRPTSLHKNMKVSSKDFFSKFLRIWTHCLKKFLIKLHFLCSNLTSFPVATDGLKDSPVNGCNCGSTLTSSHTSIRSDNVIFLTRLCRNDTKSFFLQKACWRSKFSPHVSWMVNHSEFEQDSRQVVWWDHLFLPLTRMMLASWMIFVISLHCVKCVRIRSFSGPHFPTFGLNIERYCLYSVLMWGNADQNNFEYGHF